MSPKKRKGKKKKSSNNNIGRIKFWSAKVKIIYAVIAIILTLIGFRNELLLPLYEEIFPDTLYKDDLDGNIRGEFLKSTRKVEKDSLSFIIGSSIKKEVGFIYNAYDLYRNRKNVETYSCFWPNDFIIVKGHIEYCPINYRFANDGRILFSAEVFDLENEKLLYLSDSELILNSDDLYKVNGDDSGFELIDSKDRVLFSADFIPPNQIWFQGVFYNGKNTALGFVNKSIIPIQLGDKKS